MESDDSTWTREQDKLFESALSIYGEDTPDRWHNVAMLVRGKTVEEVKRHYKLLQEDIELIQSGKVPSPNYEPTESNDKVRKARTDGDGKRVKKRKLQ